MRPRRVDGRCAPRLLSAAGRRRDVVRAALGGRASDELCAAPCTGQRRQPVLPARAVRALEPDARRSGSSSPAAARSPAVPTGSSRRWLARVRAARSARARPRAGAGGARGRLRAAPRGGDRRLDMGRPLRWPPASFVSRCWPPTTRRASSIRWCARRSRRRWTATSATRPIAPPPACCTPRARRPDRSPHTWSRVRHAGDPWVRGPLARGGASGDGRRRAAGGGRAAGPRARRAARRARAGRGPARGGPRRGGRRSETACARLEEALALADDPGSAPRSRSRWPRPTRRCSGGSTRSTCSSGRCAELGDGRRRRSPRASRASSWSAGSTTRAARRGSRRCSSGSPRARSRGAPAEALAVAQGMARFSPAGPRARPPPPLEAALARAGGARRELGHARGAAVGPRRPPSASTPSTPRLAPMVAEVQRSGSARGLVAVYSTLGLLSCAWARSRRPTPRPGSRSRVLQEGDFAPGPRVRGDRPGRCRRRGRRARRGGRRCSTLLPQAGWPAGVGTVLIPAARGRLRLAQGRPPRRSPTSRPARSCSAAAVWGMEMREIGYVHARSGAALALLRLGRARARPRARRGRACRRARVRDAARARGRAARRRARPRRRGRGSSCWASRSRAPGSPALLERARSLAALGRGAAPGRAGATRREPLAEALDLAARCGARPLAARAREELRRPARARGAQWRTGRGGADAQRAARRAAGRRRAAPTARSRTSSTSPSRPSRATWRAPTPSSGSTGGASSRRPSTEKRPGCPPSSEAVPRAGDGSVERSTRNGGRT